MSFFKKKFHLCHFLPPCILLYTRAGLFLELPTRRPWVWRPRGLGRPLLFRSPLDRRRLDLQKEWWWVSFPHSSLRRTQDPPWTWTLNLSSLQRGHSGRVIIHLLLACLFPDLSVSSHGRAALAAGTPSPSLGLSFRATFFFFFFF